MAWLSTSQQAGIDTRRETRVGEQSNKMESWFGVPLGSAWDGTVRGSLEGGTSMGGTAGPTIEEELGLSGGSSDVCGLEELGLALGARRPRRGNVSSCGSDLLCRSLRFGGWHERNWNLEERDVEIK